MHSCLYDAVLFDLDGTVSESHPGIIASAKQAIEEYGWPMPADFDYRKFIGPPIVQSLMQYAGMPEKEAEICLRLYRKYYNGGEIFNAAPYPGIPELMRQLKKDGVKVCLATSKPQQMADKVAEHLGVFDLLSCLAGADAADKESDKPGLIARCLRETGVKKERAVMIGDTRFDAEGAAAAGVSYIGVLYGYGTKEEMVSCGASVFAKNAEDLFSLLYAKDGIK